ncbi:MAG: septal ring lytic transglycosylase RlpA family protein [Candidatus Electrothrix sp. Rat3]|nr:septal ring lytic transglycosylase RlpA family protein [Candidatus Electrothrix rattekaaiensis]
MSTTKSSRWKSISLTPLLLLCLLLLVNGCTSKKLATEPQDATSEIEVLRKQEEENKKEEQKERKEQEDKEVEKKDGQREEAGQQGKQQKKKKKLKKRKKLPATQRPYVIEGQTYFPVPSAEGYEETGLASWYGDPFHGRKTANGETYDMYGVTAAHKTLPMNTMLLVKNLANGKTTTVRINDRGPFVDGRIIDLSYTTAKKLGVVHRGTEKVQIIALCAAEEQGTDRELLAGSDEYDVDDAGNKEERGKDLEIPVLAVQGKQGKKKKSKAPARVTGAMCAVIRPDGKKQRIRQNFDKGNFYIQVGSFEEKAKASKLARTFAAKGRNVIIQKFAAAGTSLFRVQVFSSTSLKEAKKHKEKLATQGFEHAFVIARDNKPQGKGKKKTARKGGKESGKGLAEKIAASN